MFETFKFGDGNLVEADRTLAASFAQRPRPVIQAWRAFVRATAFAEQRCWAFPDVVEEADALSAIALEAAPDNPIVLGLRAHVNVIFQLDEDAAVGLATEAVRRMPASPLLQIVLAETILGTGDAPRALATIRRARAISTTSNLTALADGMTSIIGACAGDYDTAIAAAEAAEMLAPAFVAPMRYRYMMLAATGRHRDAQTCLRRWRRLEPHVSIETVASPGYPMRDFAKRQLAAGGLLKVH